jgi:hypothetical protein
MLLEVKSLLLKGLALVKVQLSQLLKVLNVKSLLKVLTNSLVELVKLLNLPNSQQLVLFHKKLQLEEDFKMPKMLIQSSQPKMPIQSKSSQPKMPI